MRYSVWFLGKIWFSGAHFHWRMNLISLLCKSWGVGNNARAKRISKRKAGKQASKQSQPAAQENGREGEFYVCGCVYGMLVRVCSDGFLCIEEPFSHCLCTTWNGATTISIGSQEFVYNNSTFSCQFLHPTNVQWMNEWIQWKRRKRKTEKKRKANNNNNNNIEEIRE